MIQVSKFSLTKTEINQSRFERFRQDDEGGMIIFTLFMFVLILALTGMAVDLMRFESTRAKLVGTNDRAVLAAADLDQRLSPEAVVRDYYDKANILPYLDGAVEYEPAFGTDSNYRIVTANGSATIPTFFFGLPNFLLPDGERVRETLTATATATAEERVSDIEVSLVLDVSSSMNSNGRIEALIPAAQNFVTTVLGNNTNTDQGLVTISVVPYSGAVNVGINIAPSLEGLQRTHNYSTCVHFEDELFETSALDLEDDIKQIAHFNVFDSSIAVRTNPLCQSHAAYASNLPDTNAIVPVSSDETLLNLAIGNLAPYGNTATDIGVKWGLALMDPSTRDMITDLSGIAGNSVPTEAAGRPFAFPAVTDVEGTAVQKILVIMTDGANSRQSDVVERFKTDLSFVWFNLAFEDQPLQNVVENNYSIQYAGQNTETYADDQFYTRINRSSTYTYYPTGFSSNAEYAAAMIAGPVSTPELGEGRLYTGDVLQASWQDLMAVWSPNVINSQLMDRARRSGRLSSGVAAPYSYVNSSGETISGYMPTFDDSSTISIQELVDTAGANTRLSNICTVARDQGVIIYTVALETTTEAQDELALCADASSRSFNVAGPELEAAFDAIATNIGNLKLTQ